MSSSLIPIVIFAAAAPQPITPVSEGNRQILQTYVRCAANKAVSLVPSGEPAETIAAVAVNACESLIGQAADAAYVEWHMTTPGLTEWESRNGAVPGARDQILSLLRKQARDNAVAAVVETKAKAGVGAAK